MTALREARLSRRWSQARVLHELNRRANDAGITLPAAATMKTAISRWENGHRAPDEMYRGLFRAVFGLTDEQLGFTDGSTTPGCPTRINPDLLGMFSTSLDHYAVMDALGGYAPLLAAVQDQARYLDAMTNSGRGSDRTLLVQMSARFSEFAGWLHQDCGDQSTAIAWTDRAMDCAQQLGDDETIAYVLQRKSNIAGDAGQTGLALGLAEAALRHAEGLSPRIRAVSLRQHANAAALAGDRESCLRSLDEAAETARLDDENQLGAYCTPAYVDMEAGSCLLLLREPARAVEALRRSVAAWPAGQERDRGLCLSRLAVAHGLAGDLDAAAAVGLDAVDVLGEARSERSVAQLRRLRVLLAGSRTVENAKEFEEAIDALIAGDPV
jgi:hypothetical protein